MPAGVERPQYAHFSVLAVISRYGSRSGLFAAQHGSQIDCVQVTPPVTGSLLEHWSSGTAGLSFTVNSVLLAVQERVYAVARRAESV